MKRKSLSKRDKVTLVRAVCRNCGTQTVGRYCHACGQDLFAGRGHNPLEMFNDSLGNIFAWDNKLFRTLWCLIAYPGRLTREFVAGRIVRYVYPSKLFWFIIAIFFALLISLNGSDVAVTSGSDTDPGEATHAMSVDPAERVEAAEAGEIGEDESIGNAVEERFFASLPYLVLLLVPVFAFFVRLFFWRREYSYGDYLVFSFHFNSFVFLLFTLGAVWEEIIFPGTDVVMLLFVTQILYLGVALRKVYRPRIVPMIFKMALVGLLYLIAMLILLVIFVMALEVLYKIN